MMVLSKTAKKSKIINNFFSLSFGKLISDLLILFFFIILARFYGQEGIGQYSFAIALTGFFKVLYDLGLYTLSIKEMSLQEKLSENFFGLLLSTRMILTFPILILLCIFTYYIPFQQQTKYVILIIGSYQVLYAFMNGLNSIFVSLQIMHFYALFEFSLRLLIALSGVSFILLEGKFLHVLCVFPLITFIHILLLIFIINRRFLSVKFVFSFHKAKRLLTKAIPYGLTSFFRQASTRSDIVIIGFILGEIASGTYNIAYRIIFSLLLFPIQAGTSIFPVASHMYHKSHLELQSLFERTISIAILLGIPASAGIWLIASDIIIIIYGKDFTSSIVVLQYLSFLFALTFLKSFLGRYMIACDYQNKWTKDWGFAALINVLLNILFIYFFGIVGASLSILVTNSILITLFIKNLKNIFDFSFVWPVLLISCIGTSLFVFTFTFFEINSTIFVIIFSIVIYILFISLFKKIRKNEMLP